MKGSFMKTCNIGLIGAGTVGGGVIKVFDRQSKFFNEQLALPIILKRIVDLNTNLFSTLPVGNAICSTNADDIINDPDIQIVIELIGGTTIARTLVLRILNAKKHVITANKALLAEYGSEIFETAERNGVSVFFEASVGGGMPIIKTIRESLIGNNILSVKTIINGTCNYILSQMSQQGVVFEDALKSAQQQGFAEADPTLDIGGFDSGHKVAIMASLLYGGYVPYDKIHIEGIAGITANDIAYAKELGYCIKLLGVIKKEHEHDTVIDVRVHPAMLRTNHILASVSHVFNAVLIRGDVVGDVLLYGKGAGEMPTASAVVGDIIDVARNIIKNSPQRIPMGFYCKERQMTITPISSIVGRYYLRFSVVDKTKVLATIASVLGEHGISIASVMQQEAHDENFVPIIMLSHEAQEQNLQKAITEIEKMNFVKQKTQLIRIEE